MPWHLGKFRQAARLGVALRHRNVRQKHRQVFPWVTPTAILSPFHAISGKDFWEVPRYLPGYQFCWGLRKGYLRGPKGI